MNEYTPYKLRKNITEKIVDKWNDVIEVHSIPDGNKVSYATYLEKHSKWDSSNEDGRNTISTSSLILSKIDQDLFDIHFVSDMEESEYTFNTQDKFTQVEKYIIDRIVDDINTHGIDRKIESIHNNTPKPNLYIDIIVTKIDFGQIDEKGNYDTSVKTKYKII